MFRCKKCMNLGLSDSTLNRMQRLQKLMLWMLCTTKSRRDLERRWVAYHSLFFRGAYNLLYYDAELRIKYHSFFYTTLSLLITEHQLYHTLYTIQYCLCSYATSTVPLYLLYTYCFVSINNMLHYSMLCFAMLCSTILMIYLLCYILAMLQYVM